MLLVVAVVDPVCLICMRCAVLLAVRGDVAFIHVWLLRCFSPARFVLMRWSRHVIVVSVYVADIAFGVVVTILRCVVCCDVLHCRDAMCDDMMCGLMALCGVSRL